MVKDKYTAWWLALPIEEKNQLRAKAHDRALEVLAKIIHRAGVESNRDPAVCAVLDVTCRQLVEMATDIEILAAFHPDARTIDAGSGI